MADIIKEQEQKRMDYVVEKIKMKKKPPKRKFPGHLPIPRQFRLISKTTFASKRGRIPA